MKNKKIKGLKVFSTMLLSGTLIFASTGCCEEKANKREDYSVEDSFHDDNNTGIDDYYEEIVVDSKDNIEELNKIEKIIDIIPRIQKINGIDYNKESKIEKSNEVSLEELDMINDLIKKFEDNNLSSIEIEESKKLINEEYSRLVNYLLEKAPNYIKNALLEIAKTIGTSTDNLDTIDNMKVYMDYDYFIYSGHKCGWFEYNDNDDKKIIRFEERNSDICDLVEDYINYDNLNINDESINSLISKYKKSLSIITNAVHNNYKIENELLEKNPVLKYK